MDTDRSNTSNIVRIQTDKEYYFIGEEITGKVILSLAEGLHVDSINLKFSGYELTNFRYAETTIESSTNLFGKTTMYQVTKIRQANESTTVYQLCYLLCKERVHLLQGEHSFQFAFKPEEVLSGSFVLCNPDAKDKGLLQYEIRTEVLTNGNAVPNIKCYQDILLFKPYKNEIMSMSIYKETNVTFLCCIPKGKASVTAVLDKNVYSTGDDVVCKLIVDTSALQVDVPKVTVRLMRVTTLNAEGVSAKSDRALMTKEFEKIPKGEVAERCIEFFIPKDSPLSFEGRLTQCRYEVVIDIEVPWSPSITSKSTLQVIPPFHRLRAPSGI
jgi:hypothetical protein